MQPPLHGERLMVRGPRIGAQAEVEVYDASESRIQFSADGTVVTVQGLDGDHRIDLQTVPAVPHMFLNPHVLVLYFGTDEPVLTVLTVLLGQPVAGPERLHRSSHLSATR